MPALLTLRFTDRPARCVELRDDRIYVVGREAGCAVRIDDDRVSRRHARIETREGRWSLSDLDSKNGVLVDGVRVVESRDLPGACWLSLGGLLARFEPMSEDEERRRARRTLELWTTTAGLRRGLDPGVGLTQLLGNLLDSVLKVSTAERAFVLLVRPDGGLEVAAAAGAPEDAGFPGSSAAVERAVCRCEPVVAADARHDAALGRNPSVAEGGIRALVCLPLEVLGRPIGALYADSTRHDATFAELDLEILDALTSHAALGIAVARLRREVESLAGEVPTRWSDPAEAETVWERALPAYRPGRASEAVAGSVPPPGTRRDH